MGKYLESTEKIFGTRVYQKIDINNMLDGKRIIVKAIEVMKDFEKKLSFYNEYSDISKINNIKGKSFVEVSKDTFEIIKKSVYYGNLTDGLFDITIAPLIKSYGFNTASPKVLSENEINNLLSFVNYRKIEFDENNCSIKINSKDAKIDLGGIAKGYIADKIIEFYRENNVKAAIINIGGNIKVLGKKEKNKLWTIGIYEPKKHSDAIVCSIDVEDKSIVTSGAYERAFISEGKFYHHILNPKTGYPAECDLKSITIVSDESITGDGLSTPLFIMGKYRASEFMKTHNISGIIIDNNNQIILTRDLLDSFTLHKDYKVLCF